MAIRPIAVCEFHVGAEASLVLSLLWRSSIDGPMGTGSRSYFRTKNRMSNLATPEKFPTKIRFYEIRSSAKFLGRLSSLGSHGT